jgi:hypothetical protein
MRLAPALTLALAAVGQLHAQVGEDVRFVVRDNAEVRNGPSDAASFDVTNRLSRGQPVKVTGEMDGGWLRIKPPEGSFSWINMRYLQQVSPNLPNYVVNGAASAPVIPGSSVIRDRRPGVIGQRMGPGSQVVSIGQPVTDMEGSWMPIDPPAGEVRYIRAADVQRSGESSPPGNSTLAAGAAAPAPAGPVSRSTAPSANAPPSPQALWQQAIDAERAGHWDEAIRLWAAVGGDLAGSNPAKSAEALQRARYLQGWRASLATAPASSSFHATTHPGSATAPLRPVPAPATPVSRGATPSSWPTYAGRLSRAGRAIEGRTAYRLEAQGYPLMYVVGAGIDLEPYVGRNVQLTGPAEYNGDLRANFMSAAKAVPMP